MLNVNGINGHYLGILCVNGVWAKVRKLDFDQTSFYNSK